METAKRIVSWIKWKDMVNMMKNSCRIWDRPTQSIEKFCFKFSPKCAISLVRSAFGRNLVVAGDSLWIFCYLLPVRLEKRFVILIICLSFFWKSFSVDLIINLHVCPLFFSVFLSIYCCLLFYNVLICMVIRIWPNSCLLQPFKITLTGC